MLVIGEVATIFLVEVSQMGLFKRKQVIETQQTEEVVPELASIRFEAGKGGKGNHSRFLIGNASIPASVVTRIERLCQDQPEDKKPYLIYSSLMKQYGSVLEAMDSMKLPYTEAIRQMTELKPVKKVTQGHRGSRIEKTAQMLGKVICRRWKGTEAEIMAAFFETIQHEVLKTELSKVIQGFEAAYGRTDQGFIKANARKGRPDLKGKAIKRK